jgi:hypothetical protein
MKLEIKFYDDKGEQTRALNVEGNRSDLAHAILALSIEWEQYATGKPKAEEGSLTGLVGKHFGQERAQRLHDRIAADEDQAASEFFTLVVTGQARFDQAPDFIGQRIRGHILSELPEMPEALLDMVVSTATEELRAAFQEMTK